MVVTEPTIVARYDFVHCDSFDDRMSADENNWHSIFKSVKEALS